MLPAGVIREGFTEESGPELSPEGLHKTSTGRETSKGGKENSTEKHQENKCKSRCRGVNNNENSEQGRGVQLVLKLKWGIFLGAW